MTIHSPLDRKTWFEALARNALQMADSCTDQTLRATLLQTAEGWALLAHLQAAEHKDHLTA
jgi:hypothetical protein